MKKNNLGLMFLIAIGFLQPVPTHALPTDSTLVVLRPGELKTLKVDAKSTIRVSSSQVVRVVDKGSRINVFGRKVGRSIISYGGGAYRVEVVAPEVEACYLSMQKKIQKMMGLRLDVANNESIVTGELLRFRDWQSLAEAQAQSGGRWKMNAQINEEALPSVSAKLKTLGFDQSGSGFTLHLTPYPHLTGSKLALDGPQLKARIEHYGLNTNIDSVQFAAQPVIRLRLTFTEILSSATERLGLEFNDGQAVQVLPQFSASDQLAASLKFMTSTGEAKILATPSLSTRSGQEAEFLAGGEFAVKSSNHRTHEISWKRYGLWLKFKPILDPSGVVRLDIQTEFSLPDWSQSVEGVPNLRTSRTNSGVDMPIGQSLLLSGLVRTWDGSALTGIKGLTDVPILGAFFRSSDAVRSRSELFVFVTPEVVQRGDTWN
jgi:pilus assembly protein CpaC